MRTQFPLIACLSAPFFLAALQGCAPSTPEEAREAQYRAVKAERYANIDPQDVAEERMRLVWTVQNFCNDMSLTEEQISAANGGGDILLEESLGCPQPAEPAL